MVKSNNSSFSAVFYLDCGEVTKRPSDASFSKIVFFFHSTTETGDLFPVSRLSLVHCLLLFDHLPCGPVLPPALRHTESDGKGEALATAGPGARGSGGDTERASRNRRAEQAKSEAGGQEAERTFTEL